MRRLATLRRGKPHPSREDPDNPGCCLDCKRPLSARSDMHIDEYPPVDPAVTEAERARLGERD